MCRMCRDLRHIVRHIKVRHEELVATHFLQQDHNTFFTTHTTHFLLALLGKDISIFFFNLIIPILKTQVGQILGSVRSRVGPISSDRFRVVLLDHGSRLAFS